LVGVVFNSSAVIFAFHICARLGNSKDRLFNPVENMALDDARKWWARIGQCLALKLYKSSRVSATEVHARLF